MAEQIDPNQARLDVVDNATLTPLVRKALNNVALNVTDWKVENVHGGFGGGISATAIFRFTGQAQDGDSILDWTLILKIIRDNPEQDPNSTHYWKREYEIYRSGWIDNLPGQFRAAICYGTVEYPGEACWIWQEDIQNAISDWSIEQHGITARHLGQFNGAYLTGRTIPEADWLGANWLRNSTKTVQSVLPEIEEMFTNPLLQTWWGSDLNDLFMTYWNQRERFLNTLDQLPQTFAHQDAFKLNLFLRRDDNDQYETVGVDWAFVGRAPLGMEIASAYAIDLAFTQVPLEQASELADALYNGYLAGLRDANWQGDEKLARLGFLAALLCKSFEMTFHMRGLRDPASHPGWEEFAGLPIQDFIAFLGELMRLMFNMSDEALAIMDELGY